MHVSAALIVVPLCHLDLGLYYPSPWRPLLLLAVHLFAKHLCDHCCHGVDQLVGFGDGRIMDCP